MKERRWRLLPVSRELVLQGFRAQGVPLPEDAELLDVRRPFGTGNFEFVVASAEYEPVPEGFVPPLDWGALG